MRWRVSPGHRPEGGTIGKTHLLFLDGAEFHSQEVFLLFLSLCVFSLPAPWCLEGDLAHSKCSVCVSQVCASEWISFALNEHGGAWIHIKPAFFAEQATVTFVQKTSSVAGGKSLFRLMTDEVTS